MHPCPSCSCHVRRKDAECPHCGARLAGATFRSTAVGALLGLAVACSGEKDTVADGTTPAVDGDADTDADSDTDPETADTGQTSGVDYGTAYTHTGG